MHQEPLTALLQSNTGTPNYCTYSRDRETSPGRLSLLLPPEPGISRALLLAAWMGQEQVWVLPAELYRCHSGLPVPTLKVWSPLTPSSQATPAAMGPAGQSSAPDHCSDKLDGCCVAKLLQNVLGTEGEKIPFYGAAVPPGSQPCCGSPGTRIQSFPFFPQPG